MIHQLLCCEFFFWFYFCILVKMKIALLLQSVFGIELINKARDLFRRVDTDGDRELWDLLWDLIGSAISLVENQSKLSEITQSVESQGAEILTKYIKETPIRSGSTDNLNLKSYQIYQIIDPWLRFISIPTTLMMMVSLICQNQIFIFRPI